MSRRNPIVERMRERRTELETLISSHTATLEGFKAEAAALDRLMRPQAQTPPTAPRKPRATRRVDVTAHSRVIGAPDAGPTLPIQEAAE